MEVSIAFNKLSVFFKEKTQTPDGEVTHKYQAKASSIELFATEMVGKKKLISLGCTLFDLKDFVGKLFEEKVMMLSGGPLLNGRLLVKVSIVQLPNSQ